MERVCKSCYRVSDHYVEDEEACVHCGGVTLDIQGAGDRIAELDSYLREVLYDDPEE